MAETPATVLAGVGLEKGYSERGGVMSRSHQRVRALAGVTLRLGRNERVGLVGSSGAGKSTVVRVIAGLERPDAGAVLFEGRDVAGLSGEARKRFRRAVQVVFQDPGAALDPRQRIGSAVAEPLAIHGVARGEVARRQVAEALAAVGLPADPEFASRHPHELSGGERQRVVIARALACQPRVLLLDEPVAALDVSVRGQVLNLILDLQQRLGLTILLVAHDIFMVRASCERMAVMYCGRIVEEGPALALAGRPAHPYTRALLAAGTVRRAVVGGGDPATRPQSRGPFHGGCPYRGMCPQADESCLQEPQLEPVTTGDERLVACWNSLLP